MTQDTVDENGFPAYPTIEAMPSMPRASDRLAFAFSLIHKHRELVGDYIYAAFRHAQSLEEMVRWEMITEIVQDILGHPLEITFDATKRLRSEGITINIDHDIDSADPKSTLSKTNFS